jgi:hypothetical protein
MKLRHAAALMLIGWYLMLPPFDRNRERDPSAPISRWTIAERYDALAKCSKAQAQRLKHWVNLGDEQMVDEFGQSVCVPTDDSRLRSR